MTKLLRVGILTAPNINYDVQNDGTFIIRDVVIGIDFHWQRKLDLRFAGELEIIDEGGMKTAVNIIPIEDYLKCVISSEMSAKSSLELLKAHAVISRSWVIANLGKHGVYDVCSDDHCQRYQGLTMAVGENVEKAIEATRGEILTYKGKIVDARYSKCCGGRTELWSTCWEDEDFPFNPSLPDTPNHEDNDDVFCHTDDMEVLSQVLNDYDLETKDFYYWTAEYTFKGISGLVAKRLGRDLGTITELIPLKTGLSGRIFELKIVGTKGEQIVGKELAIRRCLSDSHLKSSAFEVEKTATGFILHGRGWGHGVGLCQIGAAVMAARGYGYREILEHYYPTSVIEQYEK